MLYETTLVKWFLVKGISSAAIAEKALSISVKLIECFSTYGITGLEASDRGVIRMISRLRITQKMRGEVQHHTKYSN